jgi:hypothetical protein
VESIPFQELGEPERVLHVGDTVWDDLTLMKARVLRIQVGDTQNDKVVGIWIENDHVGGGRHPWEVSLVHEGVEYPEGCPWCKLGKGVHPDGGEHDFGVVEDREVDA